MFKSSVCAGCIFKAWPLLASLSPEGPPASSARPVWGHRKHQEEPDHKSYQDVQGGAAHLGGWCGHVVLGVACQKELVLL